MLQHRALGAPSSVLETWSKAVLCLATTRAHPASTRNHNNKEIASPPIFIAIFRSERRSFKKSLECDHFQR